LTESGTDRKEDQVSYENGRIERKKREEMERLSAVRKFGTISSSYDL